MFPWKYGPLPWRPKPQRMCGYEKLCSHSLPHPLVRDVVERDFVKIAVAQMGFDRI